MSGNEYARQRGRDPLPSLASQLLVNKKRGHLQPLTTAEQARVAETRAAVREHLPEAMPFIKELHELGMIDGWRDVEMISKPEPGGHA